MCEYKTIYNDYLRYIFINGVNTRVRVPTQLKETRSYLPSGVLSARLPTNIKKWSGSGFTVLSSAVALSTAQGIPTCLRLGNGNRLQKSLLHPY